MNANLMVHPRAIAADHTVFVSGDHAEAKSVVSGLLEEFGWRAGEIVDLGPLAAACGTEAWLLLWLRLYEAKGTSAFNLRLVDAGVAD